MDLGGRLRAFVNSSRGLYGRYWRHLEASEARRKREGKKAQIIEQPQMFEDVGLVEAHMGGTATWSRLGAALGPLGGMLESILRHLGLSYTLLEAIWGYLGPYRIHLGPKRTLRHIATLRSRPPGRR